MKTRGSHAVAVMLAQFWAWRLVLALHFALLMLFSERCAVLDSMRETSCIACSCGVYVLAEAPLIDRLVVDVRSGFR